MSSPCWICLVDVDQGEGPYHAKCLGGLFGVSQAPRVDVELAKLHTAGLAMVGRTSISGVQRKISVSLTADRSTLQVAIEGGLYLLKPAGEALPHLPENEHVTMRLAELVGIEIPPCGLVRLVDGSIAYVVRRFDRPTTGGKLRQEDFCQLARKPPKDKYEGSVELLARLLGQYASEPRIELLKLFRLLVFAWWTGNGDMHLKNFSLLTGADGRHRLSPAYDQLCTRLVIPDDPLALPVGGKKDGLTLGSWRRFAEHSGLPRPAADRVLSGFARVLPQALELVGASLLPRDLRSAYARLVTERATLLAIG